MWRGITKVQLDEFNRVNEIHSKRLKDIKHRKRSRSTVDNALPKTMQLSHLKFNQKRAFQIKEEQRELQLKNERLVKRINKVLHAKKPKEKEYKNKAPCRGVYQNSQLKEFRRINMENRKLVKRIRNQKPVYRAKDMHKEYQQYKKHLRALCFFPPDRNQSKPTLNYRPIEPSFKSELDENLSPRSKKLYENRNNKHRESAIFVEHEVLESLTRSNTSLDAKSFLDAVDETEKANRATQRNKPRKTEDIIIFRKGIRIKSEYYLVKAIWIGFRKVIELSILPLSRRSQGRKNIRLEVSEKAAARLVSTPKCPAQVKKTPYYNSVRKNLHHMQMIKSIIQRIKFDTSKNLLIAGCFSNEIQHIERTDVIWKRLAPELQTPLCKAVAIRYRNIHRIAEFYNGTDSFQPTKTVEVGLTKAVDINQQHIEAESIIKKLFPGNGSCRRASISMDIPRISELEIKEHN